MSTETRAERRAKLENSFLFTTDRTGAAWMIHLGDHSHSPDWIH